MSSSNSLQPTGYAKHRYNITSPIDFDVAVKYASTLMAIAGADGELAEAELQWYIDEQKILFGESAAEYIEMVRKLDWKKANIEQSLSGIKYDFRVSFRRWMLYQAIKMSRADGIYHEKEKAAVARAAEVLGIERSVLVSLESVAEMEESTERLRLALFETEV